MKRAHSPSPPGNAISSLDLDHATMRHLGHRVADVVADHLASLRDQPVLAGISRRTADELLMRPAPAEGSDFETLLATLRERVFANHAREPHPGFMAYVPSCPTFPAVLGDWLATGFNFFAGVWPVASGPNELEVVVLEWFREWLGMPSGSGGLLTSGGSGANLTAVIAARHAVAGDDAAQLAKLVMYTSDQAHSSVTRAGWIAGIPRGHIRSVPTDHQLRVRPDALVAMVREDRAAGLIPFLVVANAGTTNTGAVDPLEGLADLCASENLWLHVDAAYGGFAVLTERGKAALAGLGRADSVTLDPHKWLFIPFECGCLLLREPRALADAFRIYPEYLKDVESTGDQINFADYGEQLTRYSRALKVWLSVSYFGTTAIAGAIDTGMDLAARAEGLVRASPELELLAPARFGICCFRARPEQAGLADLDAINERILARINGAGRFFISSTRLRGAYSLRICVLGYRTTEQDIDALMAEIASLARTKA
jgi:glutamate/tyrosine decarboxylase-like PLP-dependent enzyme